MLPVPLLELYSLETDHTCALNNKEPNQPPLQASYPLGSYCLANYEGRKRAEIFLALVSSRRGKQQVMTPLICPSK